MYRCREKLKDLCVKGFEHPDVQRPFNPHAEVTQLLAKSIGGDHSYTAVGDEFIQLIEGMDQRDYFEIANIATELLAHIGGMPKHALNHSSLIPTLISCAALMAENATYRSIAEAMNVPMEGVRRAAAPWHYPKHGLPKVTYDGGEFGKAATRMDHDNYERVCD